MKESLIHKWTQALRSGEYAQCTNTLVVHDENGHVAYCCMGVLADLMLKDTHSEEWRQLLDSEDTLNEKALDEVELSDSNQDNLMGQNDRGVSFIDIADWIETNSV